MVAFCLRTTSVLSVLLFLVTSASAQDPNLELRATGPASVAGGTSFSANVLFDNTSVDAAVAGWQFGLCHDPAVLQLDAIASGAGAQTVKNGSPADFIDNTMHPGGVTGGAVICFSSCATIAPGVTDVDLLAADYTALATPIEPAPSVSTALSFCNTLGTPAVNTVVTVGTNSVAPSTLDLAITIPAEPLINPNYILRLEAPALVSTGDAVAAAVRLDNNGQNIAGWSLGVCYDAAELQLDAIVEGQTTLTVRNGQPAEFVDNQMHVGGATTGAVICFSSCAFLPAGTLDAELSILNFTALSAPDPFGPPTTTALNFCDTLGTPAITTVVTVGTNSIIPTQQGASVSIEGIPPTSFEFSFDAIESRYFIPSAPVAIPFEARMRITQTGVEPPIATQGFSVGVAHDPAMLTALAIEQGDALLAVGPTGPEFFQSAILPNGWTVATIYSLSEVLTIPYAPSQEVLRISYTTVPTGFQDLTEFQNVPLTFDDTLNAPAVPNVVVLSDGSGTFPVLVDGIAPFEPQFSGGFTRGDSNGDGEVMITDVIYLLSDLFQGGPSTRLTCFAANDMNGDGLVHLADPVFLLNYLFAAGTQPAAPFPECGVTTITDCELPGHCSP